MEGPSNNRRPQHAAVVRATHWVSAIGTLALIVSVAILLAHPQTYLAYGMNGQDIPTPHGAPVRLPVARQLGYKSIKYLSRVTVTDTLKPFGKGLGGSNP